MPVPGSVPVSVWRPGKHREKDDEWDDASLADLFDPPRTVARRPVTGSPPWDVAAGHSATWEPQGARHPPHVPDPAGVPSSVNPPTGSGTHPYPLADLGAAIAALGHEPEPFTARFEPSPVLDRARAELTTDPTFRWALRHAPLDAIADLFNPEASDG